ncbi:uncharacterized protein LOC110095567 [Dendrobium catenatum]|uniref:Uncharacterized protein n=1 Tax=Dendrobium catenatum TaxID=906689 RepID=A0A2I0W3G8_9ASPA|nr:uncharacterized protein LOC110095567 [Dendrobium catenatum]PKU70202.1 hypothetical protein MA16_Dca010323 [Dendrobium catenatum]
MAESEEVAKVTNRDIEVQITGDGHGDDHGYHLGAVLRDLLAGIAADGKTPLSHRIRVSLSSNAPRLKDASRNSAQALVKWTRQGSAARVLLVISVGTITLLALTGLLVFTLFFLVATLNAVVISLLMSLAAAGGFLALFFVFTTAIYVGALSVAAFFISSIVTLTIIGVIIATGWVGFIWVAWIAAKKSLDVTKHSIRYTGSAISNYSASRFPTHKASFKSDNDKYD